MFDFHTHNLTPHDIALINATPGFTPMLGKLYSVGIHPWDAAEASADIIRQLDRDAALQCVKAIGETGIDKSHGPSIDSQTNLLRHHIALSERLHKPLILHVVKAVPEIIALKNEVSPTLPWIIHGFRGKPQLARELLRAGFYISLGEHFNIETALAIPSGRLLVETDESHISVGEIASSIPHLDPTLPYRLLGIEDSGEENSHT